MRKNIKKLSGILTLTLLLSLILSSVTYAGYSVPGADPEGHYLFSDDSTVSLFDDDDDEGEESDPSLPQPDSDGVLNLSLTEVPKYGYRNNQNIKKVVFNSGIKDVKKEAFMGCHNLEEVIFPENNTLKRIYWSAFEDCPKLKRFICPDTIVKNGERSGCECDNRVLYGCTSLEELTLGTGVWHFGIDSFYGAEKLTSVTLPSDLHNINGNIFRGCTNLKSIEIYSDKNTYFMSKDGVLYEKINPYLNEERQDNDMLVPILYAVPTGKVKDNDGVFNVPKNITTIGPRAFYGDKALKKILISSGNQRLCQSVFEGCENLTTVVWPKSLKNVGTDAFLECTSLTSILYTGSESDWEKIEADFYQHSVNNGDNHKNIVTERKPLKENMDKVGLSENVVVTFDYENTEESTDDAADWGISVLSGDHTYAVGSKFNAAEYMGLKGAKKIKYESSNKSSVKISGKGIATVKGGSGKVILKAKDKKDGSEKGTLEVTVEAPSVIASHEGAANTTISANEVFLTKDSTTLSPKWFSSKPAVAEVDQNTGVVTLKKAGTAKIFAVFNGKDLKDKNGTRKKYKTKVKVS